MYVSFQSKIKWKKIIDIQICFFPQSIDTSLIDEVVRKTCLETHFQWQVFLTETKKIIPKKNLARMKKKIKDNWLWPWWLWLWWSKYDNLWKTNKQIVGHHDNQMDHHFEMKIFFHSPPSSWWWWWCLKNLQSSEECDDFVSFLRKKEKRKKDSFVWFYQ